MSRYPKKYRLPDGSIYSVTFEQVKADYAYTVRQFDDLTTEQQEEDISAFTECDAESWQNDNWLGYDVLGRGTLIGIDDKFRELAIDRLKNSCGGELAIELCISEQEAAACVAAPLQDDATDLDKLEYLARNASPGPWWVDSHGHSMTSMPNLETVFNHPIEGKAVRHEGTGNLSHWRNDWDASYIAAANPAAILQMIERIRELEEEQAIHHQLQRASAKFPKGFRLKVDVVKSDDPVTPVPFAQILAAAIDAAEPTTPQKEDAM